MKNCILLLLMFLSLHITAQDPGGNGHEDHADPTWNDGTAINPVIDPTSLCTSVTEVTVNEVLFMGYKVIYIKFDGEIPDMTIQDEHGEYYNLQDCLVGEYEVAIRIDDETIDYFFQILNSCDQLITIATSTHTSMSTGGEGEEGEGIRGEEGNSPISRGMSNLMTKYGGSNTNIATFLNNDISVSQWEKADFFQEFVLDNNRFESNFWCDPPVIEWDDKSHGQTICKCEQFRTSALHGPFSNAMYEDHRSYFDYESVLNTEHQNVKYTMGNDGKYWENYYALGANLWHTVLTEGWKETKGTFSKKTAISGDPTNYKSSALRGRIDLHLICMDGQGLPSECECNKPVEFSYKYNTMVDARAEVLSNWTGTRRARSQAQDMGFAFCYESTDKGADVSSLIPIEGLDVQVQAYCEAVINPQFWANLLDIFNAGVDIITNEDGNVYYYEYIYEYDSTIIQIDTLQQQPIILDTLYRVDTLLIDSTLQTSLNPDADLYKGIGASIFKVFNTNKYLDAECGEETAHVGMYGRFNTELKPNRRLSFMVMNYHRIEAGGTRSWRSSGTVLSDYWMSVVVKPGVTSGPEEECCTPWTGTYLVGNHFKGSSALVASRQEVGSELHLNGFDSDFPNGLDFGKKVRGDAGYMTRPASTGDCAIPVSGIATDEEEHTINGIQAIYSINESIKDYAIHNISGQQLYSRHNIDHMSKGDLIELIQADASTLQDQVLIISLSTHKNIKSIKLLNIK